MYDNTKYTPQTFGEYLFYNPSASYDGGLAFGWHSRAMGKGAIAIGRSALAEKNNSFAFGIASYAYGRREQIGK